MTAHVHKRGWKLATPLDPYKPVIEQMLARETTAKPGGIHAIYGHLIAEHGMTGVSEVTVAEYVRACRRQRRARVRAEAGARLSSTADRGDPGLREAS